MENQLKEKLVIREATKKDVSLILSLIKELAVYEKLLHEVVATEDQLTEMLFGQKKYAEVLIANYDNENAGFALFFHNFSTFLGKPGIYLEDLYVKPQLRGKGIGKSLLLSLVKLAKERNCGRVEWAVLNWNEPSIKFYKSLGAKPMNQWTVYRLSEDEINSLNELKS
ncbi:MAG: GNAT family N-acetyltransferase [Ignavibacteriaceae bacterium]